MYRYSSNPTNKCPVVYRYNSSSRWWCHPLVTRRLPARHHPSTSRHTCLPMMHCCTATRHQSMKWRRCPVPTHPISQVKRTPTNSPISSTLSQHVPPVSVSTLSNAKRHCQMPVSFHLQLTPSSKDKRNLSVKHYVMSCDRVRPLQLDVGIRCWRRLIISTDIDFNNALKV